MLLRQNKEIGEEMKVMELLIAQIDYNNDTVLDRRLYIMTLVKKLIEKDKKTCLSYDNLVGNFRDGQIGKKIKKEIMVEFFVRNNLETEFQEQFF